MLKTAQEDLNRKYKLFSHGYDLEWLVGRVTGLFGMTVKELLTGGKQRKTVRARSVVCYWGTRELGISAAEISTRLHIASSTASESVARGRRIVEEQGLKLLDDDMA